MKTVDMHCDTISALRKRRKSGEETGLLKNDMHVDLWKLKEGDYLLQNFALFVNLEKEEDPLKAVLELADLYYEELERNKALAAPVFSYEDIGRNSREGRISTLLTVEEGGVCKGSLSVLRMLYRLGVRMLTLTWNYPNGLGYPNLKFSMEELRNPDFVPDFRNPNTEQGLTERGIGFVQEMERLGMIVDVSHLSDAGFYDVARVTRKPFAASHSNARAVCPNIRNMTDDMIRMLAERGGVMGLNFCPDFLTDVSYRKRPDGRCPDGEDMLEAVTAHAKHIVRTGGIGCLGLGSDFDGIEGNEGLPDASALPRLYEALLRAGFHESEADRIFGGNVLRLYRDTLSV